MSVRTDLESLRDKIDKLSPAAKLLMASQLVSRGDYDCVELAMVIAENVVNEWQAAKLFAKGKL